MIYGITMVRDEADIIGVCLRHLLENEGLDRILILDNGSKDGTPDAISGLCDPRIEIVSDPRPYRQAEIMTGLARRAAAEDASWIVPFDADEFWHAPGGLARALRELPDARSVEVSVENFVQRRSQLDRDCSSFINIKYRIKTPFCTHAEARDHVTSGACAYIESGYPSKFISRATLDIAIGPGNHFPQADVVSIAAHDIRCLHVPLRSKADLRRKAGSGQRLDEAGIALPHGWHLRRLADIVRSEAVDGEWSANSEEDGCLDTARGRIALEHDGVLADLLRPIVVPPS